MRHFLLMARHIRITTSKYKSQLLTERMRFMRRRFCDVSKVVVNLGYAWTMSAHFNWINLKHERYEENTFCNDIPANDSDGR